jgi:nicotinate dehydrogenase subunit B
MNSRLTSDARATLENAGFSRRALLKGSGALIVSFSLGEVASKLGIAPAYPSAQLVGAPSRALDSWIAISADGTVTAYTGKCEIGQGLYTVQTQLVAEELGVPIERVKLIQSVTGVTPDQGVTSGAQSHPQNFNHANLALAGATARETLLQLASTRLGVPVDQLDVSGGVIGAKGDRSKKVAYGELVNGRKFNVALNTNARRKHPRDWIVLGTPVGRLDLPEMATARLEYVHNLRLPGMLHGRVVRPPTVGATLVGVDESSVRDIPGFVKVVVKNDFVGVIAEKQWQAVQAANKLKVVWNPGPKLPAQADFYEFMRTQPSRDARLVDSKDVDAKLAAAADVVKATYRHPYQMHGSMGASCAVADVKGNAASIWSPTQGVYPQRDSVAMVLGLEPQNVRVTYARGSGCYGCNGADTVSFDAALLSQAVGRPVRVQLTRKDEMAWENFGFAYVIDQRAGLDANGNIVAWDYEGWSPSRGGRPGYNQPGNVVTGFLAGFQPQEFRPRTPAPEATGTYGNGSNTAPPYITGCVGGACGGTGTVRSERVLSHAVASPFWTGPLRSPSRLQNTFAHESFIDELAARAKADPVAYRLRHLRDPRLINVVKEAARSASWETRVSPKPAAARTGVISGRGMSCVLYEGDNGYAAMVAEIEVNQDTGAVAVKRLVVVLDCGPISNPDGLRNQAEGGALHGMSRALGEEVTWDDEKVTSIDWRTYHTLPVGFSVPTIETVLVNQVDAAANGAGETSITIVAPAIANAIFDATGTRIRQVPFTPARVKAALDART